MNFRDETPPAANELTIGALLERRAGELGDAPYLFCGEESWSFADAWEQARRAARALADLGVGPGDRVAMLLDNRPEYLWIAYGLGLLGAVAVPLHTRTAGLQLAYYLRDAEPALVVCEDRAYPEVTKQAAETRIATLGGEGALDLGKALRTATPARELPEVDGRDLAYLMYTSGTTGESKGVCSSHAHALLEARYVMDDFGLGEGDRIYSPQPLFHAAGLWGGCIAALWARGSLVLAAYDSRSFWQGIAASGATCFKAVMAMLVAADRHLDVPPTHRARFGIVTPLPAPDAQAAIERRFGIGLGSNYGMTEIHPVAVRAPGVDSGPAGSAGRIVARDEVRIVDAADRDLGADAVGEIVIRPGDPWSFFGGYWRRPEATVEAWRNLWFHTGDRGRLDADGNLFFHGRLKQALRRGGENLSTYEVERIIAQHPAVEEVAIVGVPGTDGEDEVVAFVVPREPSLTEESLIGFSTANMSRHMVPRYVGLVSALPRTDTMKVRIGELTKRAQERRDDLWDRFQGGAR